MLVLFDRAAFLEKLYQTLLRGLHWNDQATMEKGCDACRTVARKVEEVASEQFQQYMTGLNCHSENPTGWAYGSRFETISECEFCGAKFAPPSPAYCWDDEEYERAVEDWNLATEEHKKHCTKRL